MLENNSFRNGLAGPQIMIFCPKTIEIWKYQIISEVSFGHIIFTRFSICPEIVKNKSLPINNKD